MIIHHPKRLQNLYKINNNYKLIKIINKINFNKTSIIHWLKLEMINRTIIEDKIIIIIVIIIIIIIEIYR